jgi:biopolymer transport protein ExbD
LPNQGGRSSLTQRPSSTRAEKNRDVYFCRISAAPFAAIFLALWLLFAQMFVPLDMSIWRSVELTRASHSAPIPGALKDDAIIVSLSTSGDMYFEQHTMPNELEGKIRERLERGAEKRIYLNVDSRAQCGDLKAVLSQISSAAIENVTFITR